MQPASEREPLQDKEARYNNATALYVAALKGYVPWPLSIVLQYFRAQFCWRCLALLYGRTFDEASMDHGIRYVSSKSPVALLEVEVPIVTALLESRVLARGCLFPSVRQLIQ